MIDSLSSGLSDEDLFYMVSEFQKDYPAVGESMAIGLLRSKGYRITRARVRQALRLTDPLGSAMRWPGVTHRRVYSVAGPNSLWHIGKLHTLVMLHIIVACNRFPSQIGEVALYYTWRN